MTERRSALDVVSEKQSTYGFDLPEPAPEFDDHGQCHYHDSRGCKLNDFVIGSGQLVEAFEPYLDE